MSTRKLVTRRNTIRYLNPLGEYYSKIVLVISNVFRLVLSSDVVERDRVKLVSVLFPEASLEGIEELIRTGMYPSRSAAVRASVRDLLKSELWQREREIPRKKAVRTRKRTSIRKKKINQVL